MVMPRSLTQARRAGFDLVSKGLVLSLLEGTRFDSDFLLRALAAGDQDVGSFVRSRRAWLRCFYGVVPVRQHWVAPGHVHEAARWATSTFFFTANDDALLSPRARAQRAGMRAFDNGPGYLEALKAAYDLEGPDAVIAMLRA